MCQVWATAVMARSRILIPRGKMAVASSGGGVRPVSPDRLDVVGPVPHVEAGPGEANVAAPREHDGPLSGLIQMTWSLNGSLIKVAPFRSSLAR